MKVNTILKTSERTTYKPCNTVYNRLDFVETKPKQKKQSIGPVLCLNVICTSDCILLLRSWIKS